MATRRKAVKNLKALEVAVQLRDYVKLPMDPYLRKLIARAADIIEAEWGSQLEEIPELPDMAERIQESP